MCELIREADETHFLENTLFPSLRPTGSKKELLVLRRPLLRSNLESVFRKFQINGRLPHVAGNSEAEDAVLSEARIVVCPLRRSLDMRVKKTDERHVLLSPGRQFFLEVDRIVEFVAKLDANRRAERVRKI